jgi:hypothetical protein
MAGGLLALLTILAQSAPDPRLSHWAFAPPREVPVPAVRRADQARTPIDAFILAKLEEKGLSFAAPADKRTLIRRAAFDLWGLPPTPDEVDAFVADESPDAFEKLVDRLLASPRYGERWGRAWLDVARYADTKGYVYEDREEARFVHAHAYRDWVIRAFNEDLPYDRFLMLQVAADRLADGADRADLAAMGFLTVGRRFINNVHDIIDDRIDTLGRGMLGLTFGCARCHDHKFDPIPTEDYYSLYGIFAASAERTLPLAEPPEQTDAAAAFAAELAKRQEAYDKKVREASEKLLERLRAQVKRYLLAVLEVESLNTEEFYAFVGPEDINPVIARHWQSYLFQKRKQFDPIFGLWSAVETMGPERAAAWLAENRPRLNPRVAEAFADAPPASMRDVAERYGTLLERAHAAPPADAADEALRLVLTGPDSPIALPPGPFADFEWFFDESTRQEIGRLNREIERWIITAPGAPPYAVIMEDRPGTHANPRVFRRGNPANKGQEVPRRAPRLLSGPEREPFTDGSGRLELARLVAAPDNPLTARVWVNRVWLHHFGEGLVRTPSDFGLRGDPPTHPELLDWLARRFVADGWSTKRLHRLILCSAVWRQSCDADPAGAAADPENRLLGRRDRRRLDFEAMRDALLAVSGRLDPTMGGRPVDIAGGGYVPRRTVYGFVDRLNVPGMFRSFDFASPDAHSPRRFVTTVPQQALLLMNGPFVIDQARALAARLEATPEGPARVETLYRLLFGRAPAPDEIELALRFVGTPLSEPPPPKATAWQYGFGEVDETQGRLKSFTPLPHFTGAAWQGGPALPDPALGWVTINAKGGHAGNDTAHAAVRRWTAPRDAVVSIRGTIAHKHAEGDGVRAFILHGRDGELARFVVYNRETEASLKGVLLKAGDTLDFVVDCRPAGNITWDEFFWAPKIESPKTDAAPAVVWDAAAEFTAISPMSGWERYAQALLLSNEFVFVD